MKKLSKVIAFAMATMAFSTTLFAAEAVDTRIVNVQPTKGIVNVQPTKIVNVQPTKGIVNVQPTKIVNVQPTRGIVNIQPTK
ncbi:MAG: hypothetical protein ACRCWY_10805 [Cellulosilyticaceae bacterium]